MGKEISSLPLQPTSGWPSWHLGGEEGRIVPFRSFLLQSRIAKSWHPSVLYGGWRLGAMQGAPHLPRCQNQPPRVAGSLVEPPQGWGAVKPSEDHNRAPPPSDYQMVLGRRSQVSIYNWRLLICPRSREADPEEQCQSDLQTPSLVLIFHCWVAKGQWRECGQEDPEPAEVQRERE